jgi:PhnB protein
MQRFSPQTVEGTTSRTLPVVGALKRSAATAVAAGAVETSPIGAEHGSRLRRIVDPFGREWELPQRARHLAADP